MSEPAERPAPHEGARRTWPPGAGEMAQLIRAHVWAATPLGPIERWPQSLKVASRLLLTSKHPMSIWWGPELIQLYNDAYREMMSPEKHPSALGRAGQETWAEVWETIGPQIEQVLAGGEATWHEDQRVPVTRHGGRQDVWWTYSFSPIDDEQAPNGIGGVLVVCPNVTEYFLSRQVALENEARQAFLLRLADTLRPLSDAIEIQAEVSRMLGEHLQADRTYYSEIDVARKLVIVRREHNRVGAPSMIRDYGFEFLKPLLDVMRQGRPFISNNVRTDPRVAALDPGYKALSVRSFVRVPLIRCGELVGSLGVANVAPRDWTEAEVALLQEVADRTWVAIERARAEAALRESEAKYRSLFQSLGTGYCVVELVFDAHGAPVDYIFLEVNAAWERQIGMSAEVIGKRMRSLFPNPEQYWFDIYGRIARTGRPERFEHWSRVIGRWYSVDAFRIGVPEQHHVAILFDDVTARKQRELNTAVLDEIGKDLARLSSPDEIMRAVGAHVGASLNVSGCVVVDVDEAKGEVTVHHGWTTEHVPSLKQTFRLEDYLTEDFSRACRAGETFVVRDTSRDERTDAESYARLKIGAFVAVPFLWEGRWTAYVAVTSIGPRDWREDEVELLTEVSNRLFLRVERARAEAALRDSEERFRGFAENSADVLWIADSTGTRLEYLSPAYERVFGEPRDTVLADRNRWRELIHPDDRDRVMSYMPRALAGETAIIHYRIVHSGDGRIVHLRDTGFLIRDAAGTITQVAGIVQDVTDMVRAGEALEAEKERFRTLAEGIPPLVWRSGAEGRWTWASPQWLAYAGQEQEESHGLGWLEAVHPDDREAMMQDWLEVSPYRQLDVECRVRRASDGAWRWHQTRSVPVRDPPEADGAEGAILEWVGTMTDIDDLKRLQAEQEVLVAELQHRTRNLLAVVHSIAGETLRSSDTLEGFQQQFSGQLRTLSRVQGLLSRSDQEPITLDALLRMELDALGGKVDGCRLILDGPEVGLRKSTVQTLALALHELATNARKYGALAAEDGRLRVTWQVHGMDGQDRRLRLEWVEESPLGANGQDASSAGVGGYGRHLIEQALPYALGARTSYVLDDAGVRCIIDIPLSGAVAE